VEVLALMRLGFKTSESAHILNCTIRAIQSKKYRIRKKLGLLASQDLQLWLRNLDA